MAKSPAAILYDESGNAVNVVLDGSVYRLRVEASSKVPTASSQTSVPASASSVTILVANSSRLGATFYNDSTKDLYLLMGSGPASTSSYSVMLSKNGGYYELPFGYTGILVGIWDGTGGAVRVTEFT